MLQINEQDLISDDALHQSDEIPVYVICQIWFFRKMYYTKIHTNIII